MYTGNSTEIAKLLSPNFNILLCSTFVIFFKVSLCFLCKDQSICVYWARLNLIFEYQQGIGGGLIKTGGRIFTCPSDDFFYFNQILF